MGSRQRRCARGSTDHLKAAVLLTVFALVGAEIVYLALNLFPKFWWATSGAGFVTALILLARIAPTVLLPFFYRFKPLDRSSLQEKLVSLSTRARVPVLGVYEWSLRRQDPPRQCCSRRHRIDAADPAL